MDAQSSTILRTRDATQVMRKGTNLSDHATDIKQQSKLSHYCPIYKTRMKSLHGGAAYTVRNSPKSRINAVEERKTENINFLTALPWGPVGKEVRVEGDM